MPVICNYCSHIQRNASVSVLSSKLKMADKVVRKENGWNGPVDSCPSPSPRAPQYPVWFQVDPFYVPPKGGSNNFQKKINCQKCCVVELEPKGFPGGSSLFPKKTKNKKRNSSFHSTTTRGWSTDLTESFYFPVELIPKMNQTDCSFLRRCHYLKLCCRKQSHTIVSRVS